MNIPKEIIDKILDVATLDDVAGDFMKLKKSGKDLYGDCPFCGASGKGKGMFVSPAKDIYKCYVCDKGGKGALKFLMQTQKQTYIEAIQFLSRKYSIDTQVKVNGGGAHNPYRGKRELSFTDIQLHSSGLAYDDVLSTVIRGDEKERMEVETSPFDVGTVNDYYQLVPGYGNDMVIYYYDLNGRQITYVPPKRTKAEPFFRIRFQNPEARKDKFGKPIKYYSPAGSGSQLYVPQKIRHTYRSHGKIETLYIQEGEKKAEKACKHGLMSVGIMGIHNLGSKDVMPQALQDLVQRCGVKRVVMLLDSDWRDLSHNIKSGDNPQRRPLSFFYAVRNFKDYMLSFRNLSINLEIYFGALRLGVESEKGIDDLLAGSLKGKEKDFVADVEETMNAKGSEGAYVYLHKITALTDYQLKDFWNLNSAADFAQNYKEILSTIPEFTISRTRYRFSEAGEFELAEPLLPEEKFWDYTDKGLVLFKYKRCYTFLQNRGYGKLRMAGKWRYVHFKDHVLEEVDRPEIKAFVMEVAEQVAGEDVQDMMYKGGHFYLGDHSIENLKFLNPVMERTSKVSQSIHFKNCFVKVYPDKVETFPTTAKVEAIWRDQVVGFDYKPVGGDFIKVEQLGQEYLDALEEEETKYHFIEKRSPAYLVRVSDEALRCHFLRYLFNVSNFHHKSIRNILDETRNIDAILNTSLHVLNKLTSLGYLCHRFHNPAVAKAVIAVDGRLTEVGASQGRTGKSLFGKALSRIMPTVYIGGKSKKLTEDQFLWEQVTEKTECVFFDDVRTNLDFEFFFPNITGQWSINAKGVGRWNLPESHPIKLFFTTNHMINGEGSSFTDRMHYLVFSDFYSDHHKPTDDFGQLFFDEWDEEQWNLFYNLVAYSLQLYFRYGLVPPPSSNIEKRKLRQMMGEEFLSWADEFYAPGEPDLSSPNPTSGNLEVRIARKELFEGFKNRLRGKLLDFYSPTRFGRCLRWYCKYKGYHFNPHKQNELGQNCKDYLSEGSSSFMGGEDKAAGLEYFTVSSDPINIPLHNREFY